MPLTLWIAAACVASSIPIAWWAIGGARVGSSARSNLAIAARQVDLRSLRLDLSTRDRLWGPVGQRLIDFARRVTPLGMIERTQRSIHLAGSGTSMDVEKLLALKMVAAIGAAILGGVAFLGNPSPQTLILVITLFIAGWVMPDVVLRRRADARQKRVRIELPDLMDQIMINVEAGQSFDAAVTRVSARGVGPASEEFRRVMQDIQLGMSRHEALNLLLGRTDVPELRETVQALSQAERYGVPLGRVLRVQADELRERRRQRAEEQAMKVPVKILFPLMVCILPALMVVIVGPGIIQLVQQGGIVP